MAARRLVPLSALCLLLAAAWVLVATSESEPRITTISAWELWTDVLRDADHLGLRLTRLNDREEMAFGDEIATQAGFFPVPDEKLQKYLDEVGGALTPHVRRKGVVYKFHLVDMPVINAFAIPGGHIYVTRSMLNFLQTEAELAALLAHEIAHVDLRHCIERFQYELQLRKVAPGGVAALAQIAYRLLTVGYSKQQEHEADVLSVMLAARAGYHPKHVLSFDDRIRDLQNMRSGARKPPRFMVEEVIGAVLTGLSDYVVTHPDPGDRIVEVYATLRKNQRDWEGERFYVGRSNHADRLSRRSEERSFEIAAYDEPPLLGAYLADRRYAPFKAFAAHVRSGLSAIAAHEATPAAAAATALRDCEQKMQPCLLYALGDRIVLGMTGEEIEAEKARYRDDVCRTPPAAPVEGCVRVSPAPDRPAEPPAGLRLRRRR